jgi:hypothetical protein
MLMMMNRQAVLSARLLTLSHAEDQWSKSIYWITALTSLWGRQISK